MKKKIQITGIILAVILLCLLFTSCSRIDRIIGILEQEASDADTQNEISNGTSNEVSDETPKETTVSSFNSSPIKAEPYQPHSNQLTVIDSYTYEGKNYYLLDAGYVRNVYLSTVAQTYYSGVKIDYRKTVGKKSSVTNTLSSTISESYTKSNTHSTRLGISAEETGGANLENGMVNVQIKYSQEFSWSWTGTSARNNSKSVTNTKATVEERSQEEEFYFYFPDGSSAPHGNYRYALYGTCDNYFSIVTSKDNQQLISMEVITCARENETIIYSQYSENDFYDEVDNAPDKKITLADDFYKYLEQPKSTGEQFETLAKTITKTSTESTIGKGVQCSGATYVTCGIRKNGKYFSGGWHYTGKQTVFVMFNEDEIKPYIDGGYSRVNIDISFTAHSTDDCYQEYHTYVNGVEKEYLYYGTKKGDSCVRNNAYSLNLDRSISMINVSVDFSGYGADAHNKWECSNYKVTLTFYK